MIDYKEDDDEPREEDKEKLDYLSNKWSDIYKRFKKEVEELQEEAGGKDNLFIDFWYCSKPTIYNMALCLR